MPAVIAAAGEKAGRRFIEFFTANIRNKNTRVAYARATGQFLAWWWAVHQTKSPLRTMPFTMRLPNIN